MSDDETPLPDEALQGVTAWLRGGPRRDEPHQCGWCAACLSSRDGVLRHMADSCPAKPQGDFGSGTRVHSVARMFIVKPPQNRPTPPVAPSSATTATQSAAAVPQPAQVAQVPVAALPAQVAQLPVAALPAQVAQLPAATLPATADMQNLMAMLVQQQQQISVLTQHLAVTGPSQQGSDLANVMQRLCSRVEALEAPHHRDRRTSDDSSTDSDAEEFTDSSDAEKAKEGIERWRTRTAGCDKRQYFLCAWRAHTLDSTTFADQLHRFFTNAALGGSPSIRDEQEQKVLQDSLFSMHGALLALPANSTKARYRLCKAMSVLFLEALRLRLRLTGYGGEALTSLEEKHAVMCQRLHRRRTQGSAFINPIQMVEDVERKQNRGGSRGRRRGRAPSHQRTDPNNSAGRGRYQQQQQQQQQQQPQTPPQQPSPLVRH